MKIISIFSVLFLSSPPHQAQATEVEPAPLVDLKWEYAAGEEGSYTDRRNIRHLLTAKMVGFENPYCLRDTLLNDPIVGANVALGATIQELAFEALVDESTGEAGILFHVIWLNEVSGLQPGTTFCKMKEQ